MVKVEEGCFTTQDGTKLYTKTWTPDRTPVASLVFVHGFSDHCNAYYDLFPTLASSSYSIQVHAFDQRGWGQSVTSKHEKGLTGPTTTVVDDISQFVNSVSKADVPLFIMGHSMGGAEVMIYVLSQDPKVLNTRPHIAGVLLEAPFIALDPASAPNFLVVAAGKLAAKLMPNRQMLQNMNAAYMSRSEQVQKDWVEDPLCHDTGTLAGLEGMLQRGTDLVSVSQGNLVSHLSDQLPERTSLWVGHGDADRVVTLAATQKLYDKLQCRGGEKEIKVYQGAYHKLHAEPDGVGEGFAKDVGSWIAKLASSLSRPGSTGNPKL